MSLNGFWSQPMLTLRNCPDDTRSGATPGTEAKRGNSPGGVLAIRSVSPESSAEASAVGSG